jgi:hypothetical protein
MGPNTSLEYKPPEYGAPPARWYRIRCGYKPRSSSTFQAELHGTVELAISPEPGSATQRPRLDPARSSKSARPSSVTTTRSPSRTTSLRPASAPNSGTRGAYAVAASRPQPDPAGGHFGNAAGSARFHLVHPAPRSRPGRRRARQATQKPPRMRLDDQRWALLQPLANAPCQVVGSRASRVFRSRPLSVSGSRVVRKEIGSVPAVCPRARRAPHAWAAAMWARLRSMRTAAFESGMTGA